VHVDWAALGITAIASLAIAVTVVALVSFALVGFSSSEDEPGYRPALSPIAGNAVGITCLIATAMIVLYALWLVAQKTLESWF
jgi:hypothetical protein